MPEFTYDGMVRYAYGFYNPNHAAALLCAILPFLLYWFSRSVSKTGKFLLGVMMAILLGMLAFTYSRTGILVALAETVVWFVLSGISWRRMIPVGWGFAAFILLLWFGGMLDRFSIDRSLLNRGDIWLAGCRLFAVNPMGTGLGASGMLASTFLLPEGVDCRTMINSHLTLLVEYGLMAGILWFSFIGYALLVGWRKNKAVFLSFAGLTVSAWLCSIFDWHVLFDVSDFGSLPLTNYVLSWLLLMSYLGMGMYLVWGNLRWKFFLLTLGIVVCLLGAILLVVEKNAPVVKNGFVIREAPDHILFLYDSSWVLSDAVWFMKKYMPDNGYCIPMEHMQYAVILPVSVSGYVALQGECAAFAHSYRGSHIHLVSPPEHLSVPKQVETIFLKRYVDYPRKGFSKKNSPDLNVIVYD